MLARIGDDAIATPSASLSPSLKQILSRQALGGHKHQHYEGGGIEYQRRRKGHGEGSEKNPKAKVQAMEWQLSKREVEIGWRLGFDLEENERENKK